MDVVVVVEGLEEFADVGAVLLGEFGVDFGEVAHFTGDDGPAVFGEPLGDGVEGGAVGDEACAGGGFGDVVVLEVGEGFDFVGSGFDGGGFDVCACGGGVGFDEADVVEEEFVASGGAELSGFEEDSDLGCGAVVVIGEDFDDDGDFVRCVAFEGDLFEGGFVVALAGAFVDGALDGVAGDADFFGLFDGGEEAGVSVGVGAAVFGCDGDFAQVFTGCLRFSEKGDLSLCH